MDVQLPRLSGQPAGLNPADPRARGQGHTCLGQLEHGLQGRDVLNKVVLHVGIQREVGQALHCPFPGPGVYGCIAQPPVGGEALGKGPGAPGESEAIQGSRQVGGLSGSGVR